MANDFQVSSATSQVSAAQPQSSSQAAQNSESVAAAQKKEHQNTQKVEQLSVAETIEEKNKEVEATVNAINDFMEQFQRTLNFSVDEDAGRTVVKVIDKTNDEIIRQIPSEDFLAISKHIDEMNNLLFSEKA